MGEKEEISYIYIYIYTNDRWRERERKLNYNKINIIILRMIHIISYHTTYDTKYAYLMFYNIHT